MPSFKIAGKTKNDLAVIAQVAGLLTADEISGMTKAQLVEVLKNADKNSDIDLTEQASDAGTETAAANPVTTRTAKRRPASAAAAKGKTAATAVRRKKTAEQANAENVNDQPAKDADAADRRQALKDADVNRQDTAAQESGRDGEVKKTPAGRRKTKSVSRSRKTEPAKEAAAEPSAAEESAGPTEKEAEKTSQVESAEKKPEEKKAVTGRTRKKTTAQRPARSSRQKPKKNEEPAAAKKETAEDSPVEDTPVKGKATEQKTARRAAGTKDSSDKKTPENESAEKGNQQTVIKFVPRTDPAAAAESSPEAATAASDQPAGANRTKAAPAVRENTDERQKTQPAAQKEPERSQRGGQNTETETQRPRRPQVETGELQSGVLEIMPDGYGFLRRDNYLQGSKDIYVPPQYIRRFNLRAGDFVTGPVKLQRETDRYQALLYIKEVNGLPPEKMQRRPHFDRLTPIYPDDRLILESTRNELSTRIIDLVAPIGKGQRGMIVSPPKAGKTILLQKIANAISLNNPESKLIVLLIDERPEEVTDMQRSINGEVVYSTFDKTPENHTKVVELVLERAMRLVELKQDVVILLDSMTRLARAYNLTINPTGRTLSGGLDPGALYGPKRFFGAARNIENGGSLTIIATSLIETGSRMDEVIFEEFKGTGNMEVYLDRKLSEKRIFPAIDINKSGTRREELLLSTKELDAVWTIRKAFSQLDTSSVTEAIINLLLKTQNNEHFISSINVSFNDKNVFDAMRGNRPTTQGQSGNGYKSGGYSSQNGGYRRGNDDD